MYYLRKNGNQNGKKKTNLLVLSADPANPANTAIELKRRASLTILYHCSF